MAAVVPRASTDLNKRILAARLRRGLSQRLISRRSGLDPGYLSRIEHGRIRPTLETALRIAEALGVPLGEILMRPAPGYADYRTPIKGLYQASSATHAGGGVTGLPGHHAVREILKDRKRKMG